MATTVSRQSLEIDAPATRVTRTSIRLNEIRALMTAIRPKQWLKNGLILLGFAFSVGEAWRVQEPESWAPLLARSVVAFLSFSAAASAAYLVNDLRDLERDRRHPTKRYRALAAGTLSQPAAVAAALLLFLVSAALAWSLGVRFALVLAAYATLTLAYSVALKDVVIVDLLALAAGFVLRAVAGAVAIGVPISPWLYLCTFLGALFIAINKRRHELTLLAKAAAAHRPALADYTRPLLDQMATTVAASTVLAYALYTVTAPNMPANHAMVATVPFVMYGVFRYLLLVHQHEAGGAPEDVLLHDRALQVVLVLWASASFAILATSRL